MALTGQDVRALDYLAQQANKRNAVAVVFQLPPNPNHE